MGVRPEDYAAFIPPLFTMTNIIGALVTMPHKIATCDLVQRLSPDGGHRWRLQCHPPRG
ncbi:shikimate 5-dehydrogenase [Klebsiella pneumoniae]|uniref:Shikimate 5-dehydrogenase n=1 Tax=Klebsiella pneumoniae TaxID=573 RepID=A0A447S7S9_KLEPN|nr:shikimate 5-dehydrogenase [Klebsiella pneumoniae]